MSRLPPHGFASLLETFAAIISLCRQFSHFPSAFVQTTCVNISFLQIIFINKYENINKIHAINIRSDWNARIPVIRFREPTNNVFIILFFYMYIIQLQRIESNEYPSLILINFRIDFVTRQIRDKFTTRFNLRPEYDCVTIIVKTHNNNYYYRTFSQKFYF